LLTTLIEKVRKSEDAGLKREAIIELGYLKDKEVYPVLVEQLQDTAASIRHAAVISMGRYGDSRAIEELVKPKILNSPVVNIRWAAVAAITKLGDYRVVDYLLKATDDSEWIIRNQAVTGLKEKIQEIIELGESRYARILIRLLSLENSEIVDLAIEGFQELGEDRISLLLDALKSPSALMRENASRALGILKSNQAVDMLIELLQDPDWRVRRSSVQALGDIGDRKAVEHLVQRLRDNVAQIQQQAVISIIKFGKLSTRSLLNALAHEKNKFSLRVIILALGEIGDVKSIPALIDLLRSSYFIVRIAAGRALVKFGQQVIDALLPTLSFNKSDIKQFLKEAANRSNPALQIRAIKALEGLEDHRAVILLKKLVEEGTQDVQEASTNALVQIGCAAWGRCGALIVLSLVGDNSLTPHFVRSLKDDSDNVRLEAVRAMARIGGADVIAPLSRIVKVDRDTYIRFEAIRLLRSIGVGYPQVLNMALVALKDSNRDVRSQAARLLGNFQDVRSINPLLRKTADLHWSVRESAEIALINFGTNAVPHLIHALESGSWTTRFRAARVLGEVGDKRAVLPLEKLLQKKGERRAVREVIQRSLNKLNDRVAA